MINIWSLKPSDADIGTLSVRFKASNQYGNAETSFNLAVVKNTPVGLTGNDFPSLDIAVNGALAYFHPSNLVFSDPDIGQKWTLSLSISPPIDGVDSSGTTAASVSLIKSEMTAAGTHTVTVTYSDQAT